MRKEYFWALITLVIAVLLAYVLIILADGKGQGEDVPALQSSTHDERLMELDKLALEAAYIDQISHLFQIWMKDDTGQPQRLMVGTRKARKAYIEAATGIDARKMVVPR